MLLLLLVMHLKVYRNYASFFQVSVFPGMDLNLLRAAAAAQAGHAAHASRVPFVPPPHFMAMAPDVPPLGDLAQPGENPT